MIDYRKPAPAAEPAKIDYVHPARVINPLKLRQGQEITLRPLPASPCYCDSAYHPQGH